MAYVWYYNPATQPDEINQETIKDIAREILFKKRTEEKIHLQQWEGTAKRIITHIQQRSGNHMVVYNNNVMIKNSHLEKDALLLQSIENHMGNKTQIITITHDLKGSISGYFLAKIRIPWFFWDKNLHWEYHEIPGHPL